MHIPLGLERLSNSTVSTPTAWTLNSICNLAAQIFDYIGNIANRVAVGQEIPTAGTVAVVVKPGPEDEVCCGCEEKSFFSVSDIYSSLLTQKNLHDDEPSEEAPMASAVRRRRVLACVLCPPFQSQRLDLLVFVCLFLLVPAEAQARVAVFAFALFAVSST